MQIILSPHNLLISYKLSGKNRPVDKVVEPVIKDIKEKSPKRSDNSMDRHCVDSRSRKKASSSN